MTARSAPVRQRSTGADGDALILAAFLATFRSTPLQIARRMAARAALDAASAEGVRLNIVIEYTGTSASFAFSAEVTGDDIRKQTGTCV